MDFKVKTICRDNEKIFALFDFLDLDKACLPGIHFKDGSQILPQPRFYKIDECEGEHNTYVCVFADSKRKTSEFVIAAVNDSSPFTLDYSKAKWNSRINNKKNVAECNRIKNFDYGQSALIANIFIQEVIEAGEINKFRGVIRVPHRDDAKPEIKFLDQSFVIQDFKFYDMGSRVLDDETTNELSFDESSFTFDVPNTAGNLIAVYHDDAHPELDNYQTIPETQWQEMREENMAIRCDASRDPAYHSWFLARRATRADLELQRLRSFEGQPKFSIIVPLYNTPAPLFKDMVASVLAQSYPNWELILVNSTPENKELADAVCNVSTSEARIKVVQLEKNLGISLNTQAGIDAATGDFISFFDHDDLLEPDLLFEYTKAINEKHEIDVLYCDEDKLSPEGNFECAFFKPDFDIDLLRHMNFVCHMLTIRKSLLDKLSIGNGEFDGAQDHNLTLQAAEKTKNFYHVPKILYHWRMTQGSTSMNANSKSYANEAGIKAVQNHLQRAALEATVKPADLPFHYDVTYKPPKSNPLVSIIIPSKDNSFMLKRCLTSIEKTAGYENYEVLVVENNSSEQETFDFYKELEAADNKIRVLCYKGEFNYSKINNFAVKQAKGDYLLFLNNDIEATSQGWLANMLGCCAREDVGAVGARLLYKDGLVQHAGVRTSDAIAEHLFKNIPAEEFGYFGLAKAMRGLSAVTAACMMTKKSTFEDAGGFEEELAVAYNDIDYCLKLREKNLLVVYEPKAELIHYESATRHGDDTLEKRARLYKEGLYMNQKWSKYYLEGDPAMNPSLSSEVCKSMYCKLA